MEQMTDRELLELAAKAGGIVLHWKEDGRSFQVVRGLPFTWNPLENDGDALRLAVMLKLFPAMMVMGRFVGFDDMDITEEFAPDPYAATRRAIVRAAAAIGQSM